jgi:hypothetical protein
MENSSLTETSMDTAGRPARALPIGSAPPTATFAARLAEVPTMSATHGIQPVGRPARRCATRYRLAMSCALLVSVHVDCAGDLLWVAGVFNAT